MDLSTLTQYKRVPKLLLGALELQLLNLKLPKIAQK